MVQKVEHQHTKLKVAGSSPAEVHFFSYLAALFRQTRPGWVWLPWTLITVMSETCSDYIATQIGQRNQNIIPALYSCMYVYFC